MAGDRVESDVSDGVSTYGLAPAALLRLVGSGAILVAVVVFALTLVVGLTDGPPAVVVGVGAACLIGLAVVAWWLRRSWVVRLTTDGYAVRLVRGVGVPAAAWVDVADAAADTRRGVRCVELALRAGGRSTIPVGLLAVEDSAFVKELQTRLQTARGLRPFEPDAPTDPADPDTQPGD